MNTADGDYDSILFLMCNLEDFKKKILANQRNVDSWHTEEDDKTLEFKITFKDKIPHVD